MPNKHDPDKICVSTWVPRIIHKKLSKLAEQTDEGTMSNMLLEVYTKMTKDVKLTKDELAEIDAQTECAAQGRVFRRS